MANLANGLQWAETAVVCKCYNLCCSACQSQLGYDLGVCHGFDLDFGRLENRKGFYP